MLLIKPKDSSFVLKIANTNKTDVYSVVVLLRRQVS